MFVVYHSILFRETKEEYDFNNAVHACTADFHHSAIAMATGLIPVGKLRCLRNKYDYSPSAERDLDDHFCSRFFRVNGRKDNMGIWREYPSGLYQSYVSYSTLPKKRTCTPYLILTKLPSCMLLFGPVRLFIFGIGNFLSNIQA